MFANWVKGRALAAESIVLSKLKLSMECDLFHSVFVHISIGFNTSASFLSLSSHTLSLDLLF